MKRNGSDKENEHNTRSPNFGLNATEKTRRDGGVFVVSMFGRISDSKHRWRTREYFRNNFRWIAG